ncbi:hypothetical protein [Paracoccus aestuariivivens]|uniref:Uncharacterized protein n=1 Tax=Paracoccus aestuariivivens TaxID=1820333 RepID=A0A6L6JBR9_9RHOB|nr:hypothetical protein [Paracoccus aestuariivivens]MTH77451.1 hypothetical protein [Paracoccus aestuariivivens]
MAKSTSLRKTETAAVPTERPKAEPARESLVERLIRARTANEMTNVIGLKPITGRSGPKIAY